MNELHTVSRGAAGEGFIVNAADAIRARSVRGEQLLVWVMFACVVSFIVWAYFAVLDEVIKGDGKVIPSSQVQVVQNLEGGIVKQINVAEGDVVKASCCSPSTIRGSTLRCRRAEYVS